MLSWYLHLKSSRQSQTSVYNTNLNAVTFNIYFSNTVAHKISFYSFYYKYHFIIITHIRVFRIGQVILSQAAITLRHVLCISRPVFSTLLCRHINHTINILKRFHETLSFPTFKLKVCELEESSESKGSGDHLFFCR